MILVYLHSEHNGKGSEGSEVITFDGGWHKIFDQQSLIEKEIILIAHLTDRMLCSTHIKIGLFMSATKLTCRNCFTYNRK